MTMRLGFLLPVAAFAALAGVFGYYLYQVNAGKDISEIPSALIDKPAPEFALPPLEGFGPGFARADLGGKVTLVNAFASWCIPCRAEHPILMRMAKDGVAIFGLNIRDKPEDAARFLKELGNPYARIGRDERGRVSIDWGIYGYPETFVVDKAGRIRYRHVGPITAHDVETLIRPMIAELNQ